MDISNYMTPTEAAFRWGVTDKAVRWHLMNEEKMNYYISKGWAKFFLKPGGKRKEWILNVEMMRDLFGEPQNQEEALSE